MSVSPRGLAAEQHCLAWVGLQPALLLVHSLSANKAKGHCQACVKRGHAAAIGTHAMCLCDVPALFGPPRTQHTALLAHVSGRSPLAGQRMCCIAAHQPGPCTEGLRNYVLSGGLVRAARLGNASPVAARSSEHKLGTSCSACHSRALPCTCTCAHHSAALQPQHTTTSSSACAWIFSTACEMHIQFVYCAERGMHTCPSTITPWLTHRPSALWGAPCTLHPSARIRAS
jgi:hypothetical protein